MKKRDLSIENISGLLIIYMILHHIFQWSDLNVINQTYWMRPLSFFMAWFFYKSGMFYKDRKCKEILLGGITDSLCVVQLDWASITVCEDFYGR